MLTVGWDIFSEEGQLCFLGDIARRHKSQSYVVEVLKQKGFEEKTVELAKQLLTAVLGCGWSGSKSLPPLLSLKLRQAFKTFKFRGKAEFGFRRNFCVQVVGTDKTNPVCEMMLVAHCKGLAPLQRMAMGCVVTSGENL